MARIKFDKFERISEDKYFFTWITCSICKDQIRRETFFIYWLPGAHCRKQFYCKKCMPNKQNVLDHVNNRIHGHPPQNP